MARPTAKKNPAPDVEETRAVATIQTGSELALPDFMAGYEGQGTENISTNDVEIPRIKLMQAMSPELKEHGDLRAGDFFHTLAETNLGNRLRITPIYTDQRFILWNPRKAGGGILARADDGVHWSPANRTFQVTLDTKQKVVWKTARTVAESGLDKWGSEDPNDPNSPPAATRMYNIVCSFPDYPELGVAVVTLQRSGIRVARNLLGKMKVSRAPSFGLIYEMRSVEDGSSGEEYFNYGFTGAGLVTDRAVFEENRRQYEFFKSQGLAVKDVESLDDRAEFEEQEESTRPDDWPTEKEEVRREAAGRSAGASGGRGTTQRTSGSSGGSATVRRDARPIEEPTDDLADEIPY